MTNEELGKLAADIFNAPNQTMVERVARAIIKEWGWDWEKIEPRDKQAWLVRSRAAIEAMREPSAAMLKSVNSFDNIEHIDQDPEYYWSRMIDAALAEKPTSAPEPIANDFITVYEHCVRKLRRMRVTGESLADIKEMAVKLERVCGIDGAKALDDAQGPGSIEGYPFTAAEEEKAREAGLIP